MGNTLITRKQLAIELEDARKRAEEALKESEAFNSSLLESALNPIVVINIDASIRYINPACEKLTGFTLDEVAGREIPHPWWPEEDKEEISASIEVSMGSRGRRVERVFQKKSGERFWVELNMAPVMHDGTPQYYVANWFDITERKKREQLQNDENHVLTLLGQGVELSELLDAIVRLGEYHAPSIKGSVLLFDSSIEQLVQASAPSLPDDYKELFKEGIPIGPNAGSCGTAAYLKKRVIVPDIENSPLFKTLEEVVKRTIKNGLLSCCSEPIIASSGELLGTIANYGNKVGEPDVDSLRVLEWSARIAAIAIENRRAGEALRESEEKFSRAFGASPNSMSITTFKDGIFLEVNDSFTRDNGYTREEVIGRSSKELNIWVKPEERDRILELLRECGKAENEEYLARTKTGEISTMLFSAEPINVNGKPCIIAVTTDITERKRVEEALREREKRFSDIAENVLEWIWEVDADGKYTYSSRVVDEILGYKPEEVVGKHFYDLFLPEEREELKKAAFEAFAQKQPFREFENRNVHKNGKIVWLLTSGVPVMDEGGNLLGYRGVDTDITGRKQARETLDNEAVRRRILIEQSSDGIVILDENGKVCEANRRFAEMLGYSFEEVLQLYVWDWDTQFTHEQLLDMLRSVSEAGDHFETYHQRKDGTIVDVEISTNGATFAGQKLIFCVCRDITERKRAEAALRESEEKYSALVEKSVDGIVILQDGVLKFVSPISLELVGYRPEELVGTDFMKIIMPESREVVARRYAERIAGKKVKSLYEISLIKKDGTALPAEVNATVINYEGRPADLVLIRDITERNQAEEALRVSEEKYHAIFEQASDSIVLIETETGALVDFNDRAYENLGYNREEFARLKIYDIDVIETPEDSRKRAENIYGGRIDVFETKLRAKDGDIRDVLVSSKSLNIGGNYLALCVWHDITGRKRAEEMLKQALSNLENANVHLTATNKELEAFSYSVSHDLRAPLRSIDGFSQALLEDYMDKLDEPGQDYLGRLRAASQKMGELIDGMLKLSRLTRSEMHKENVDLSMLAQEIMTNLQQTQPERRVECFISQGLVATGDHQLLRALLENLLGNAWKFTGKRQKARIEFGATRNGDKEAYFVRDNGAGFDMNYADKLFGAFQRLHEATEFPGTGIGLATVQRIIHCHGGSVWAEGVEGKGATFYFTLG